MNDSGEDHTDAEAQRVHLWRMGMIADLGPALRSCIRYMFPQREGLLALLEVARRYCASSVTQQGMLIYWEYLHEYMASHGRTREYLREEGDPWQIQ